MGDIFEDIKELERIVKRATDRIEQIKKKAAESKSAAEPKPELRHGDYGYDDDGTTRICILDGINSEASQRLWPTRVLGNIFDDLKALGEDVEEVKATDPQNNREARFRVNMNGGLYVELQEANGDRCKNINLPADTFLKLRQMLATHKRKEEA